MTDMTGYTRVINVSHSMHQTCYIQCYGKDDIHAGGASAVVCVQ